LVNSRSLIQFIKLVVWLVSLEGEPNIKAKTMKNLFFSFLLLPFVSSAQDTVKYISIEPHIGHLFVQTVDNTTQQNKTTAKGFTINPHITFFINQQLECGIQPSITVARSEFPSIASGEGYSIGYLFRYYPKRFILKETVINGSRKFVFIGHPFIGFKHDISTMYPNEKREFRFSNHLQTHNFLLSAGLNVYFWRRFYFNFSAGCGYTPAFINKPFYFLSNYSFGYTIKNNKF
jgi:hypothetical protein